MSNRIEVEFIRNICIESISKVCLILLISLVSLLFISNILVFAEDKKQEQQYQEQEATISPDSKDQSLFTFFENFKKAINNSFVIENVKESTVIMKNAKIIPVVMMNAKESTVISTQNMMSRDGQVLMMLDIPDLTEKLMNTKESVADAKIEESLIGITEIENQFLLLQNKATFTGDFQKIKESLAQRDLAKALDYITNIQIEIIKAETEIFKTQLSNLELVSGEDNENNRDVN
jgi:hypothetical protein